MKVEDFTTVEDIIRYHRGHFFTKDMMRFFRSRVLSEVFAGTKEVYFVTSERMDSNHPRAYTVRAYNPKTDSIRTVLGFNRLTRSQALALARNLSVTVGRTAMQ
jgi:hypothetical protein